MAAPSHWGTTPRQSVEAECARRGREQVVAGCVALLAGRDADPALLLALGGPPARAYADGAGGPDHWPRVWAARGLLWAWHPDATAALRDALQDDAWRVREKAAQVAARHLVGDALDRLVELQHDPVARVRTAAARAIARITAAGG